MNAFYASKNFDAFIVIRSSQPERIWRKTLTQSDPAFWDQIILAQHFEGNLKVALLAYLLIIVLSLGQQFGFLRIKPVHEVIERVTGYDR